MATREPHPSAAPFVPAVRPTLQGLREAAAGCTGCHLYQRATQTVFGEGEAHARVMLVGEQPGNDEDLSGRPFVGPAGKLLDRALEEAGIDRRQAYVTNAVKHFKWEPRGKRRIHAKPNAAEIAAAVARRRDLPDPSHGSRLPRRDGCPGSPRATVSCHSGARTIRSLVAGAIRPRDRSSLSAAPRPRRGDAPPRDAEVRGRPAGRGRGSVAV